MNVVLNRALFVVVERDVILGEAGFALSILQQDEPDHLDVFGRACVFGCARGCDVNSRTWGGVVEGALQVSESKFCVVRVCVYVCASTLLMINFLKILRQARGTARLLKQLRLG